MRYRLVILTLLLVAIAVSAAKAERLPEKRDRADCVLSGTVTAVYSRETEGYREYIVEIKIEEVEKGAEFKKDGIFRALCSQRKDGKGGLEFDSAGHKAVPKEGQRVKVFVNRRGGRYEGVYPDWFDVAPATK